jgi:hypothetical protein
MRYALTSLYEVSFRKFNERNYRYTPELCVPIQNCKGTSMKQTSFLSLVLASLLATGCSFEQSSKLFTPTAPSDTGGAAGSTTGGSTSGGSSTGAGSATGAASAFAGNWGSSTIAGLPLGNCSDVKWLITAQTASSVEGSVTANCASGVTVSANLTGTLQNESVIDLTAAGTLTAMGFPASSIWQAWGRVRAAT